MIRFNFARKILSSNQNIIFKFILKADVDNTRVILNERFEGVTQITGTRSFHEFSPIDQCSIGMKRTSEDKEPSCVHNVKNQTKQNSVVQVLDVQVKFMHPSGPSTSFQWQHVDDICWVSNDHILCKIDIPIT